MLSCSPCAIRLRSCSTANWRLSSARRILVTATPKLRHKALSNWLVAVVKGYEDNRPHTAVTITPAGQQQFLEYLSVLEQVLRDAAPLPASPSAAEPDLA